MYVSKSDTRPSDSSYTYRGIAYGSDVVTLPPSASGRFYIGVKCTSSASYSISFSEIKVLSEGMSKSGTVTVGAYDYYKFIVPTTFKAASRIKITLTSTLGDPDMYISKTKVAPTSVYGGFTYSASTSGSDSYTISSSSWLWGNTFYIGVKGDATISQYSIKFSEVSSSAAGAAVGNAIAGWLIAVIAIPSVMSIIIIAIIIYCCCCKKNQTTVVMAQPQMMAVQPVMEMQMQMQPQQVQQQEQQLPGMVPQQQPVFTHLLLVSHLLPL